MNAMPDMIRQTVHLTAHSYQILIGKGVFGLAGRLIADELALPEHTQIFIVTDENVASHYVEPLLHSLRAVGLAVAPPCRVPAGENSKSFSAYEGVITHLIANKIKRDSVIIALGGGVIGDLAGFAAATVLRGIRLLQIPTSLLAQVDSSVGGKTGINTSHGKNLVGAFYHPALVLADIGVLDTLPRREIKAGYAEILKYALLGDREFFRWLQEHGWSVLAGDVAARTHAVAMSCAAKADIVMADPFERNGRRALLNLGHTFGHALEALGGYDGRLLHGEAVAIGMRWAFGYAVCAGACPAKDAAAVAAHMDALELMAKPPFAVTATQVLEYMTTDKKNSASGDVTLILPRSIGDAFVARDTPREGIATFLASVLQEER